MSVNQSMTCIAMNLSFFSGKLMNFSIGLSECSFESVHIWVLLAEIRIRLIFLLSGLVNLVLHDACLDYLNIMNFLM